MIWNRLVDGRKSQDLENEVPKKTNANQMLSNWNEQAFAKMFALPSRRQSQESKFATIHMVAVDKNFKPNEIIG